MFTRLVVLSLAVHALPARAVVFASTGDSGFNTSAPTGAYANSGWQYEGQWMGFIGTPIAPQYFITAKHVSGSVGTSFTYQGLTYTTDAFYDSPNSDLRIWHVTTAFQSYAPLYTGLDELNKELVVFGRGTQRGSALAGHGWMWGTSDGVMRWGTNLVSGADDRTLTATFDNGFSATEAALTVGDSGGGVFIQDSDGVWKLAGINLGVSGPYKATVETEDKFAFNASLYDQSGYFAFQEGGTYAAASGPGEFEATRISTNLAFIRQVTAIPEPSTTLVLTTAALWLGCARARRRVKFA